MHPDCLQGISDAKKRRIEEKEMAVLEEKNYLKAAVSTAGYWARSHVAVPAKGSAKFGPFEVRWVEPDFTYQGSSITYQEGGIEVVKDGLTRYYFIPA